MTRRIHLAKEPRLDAKLEAFDYQRDAFRATRDLTYAAIFHEQGLGKTKIGIDLALYWLESKAIDTVMIVVKKSLISNWKRELNLHTHLTPRLLTQSRTANFFVFNSPARAILAHYEVFKSEQERLRLFLKSRSVAVILDESTKIKNPAATLTQVFLELSPLFVRRVIMTGTPVANRPYDLWAQVCFLDQGKALGSNFDDFKATLDLTRKLSTDIDAQRHLEQALGDVFPRISDFTVRENKADHCIELPDKVVRSRLAHWETHQYDLYERIRLDLRAVVIRDGIPQEDRSELVLKRLVRLIQAASNPRLIDSSYGATPGKLPVLLDLVDGISRRGEKAIVWSSFVANVEWLAGELADFGTCKLHGKMDMQRRDKQVSRFLNDSTAGVLVATPGAAKEGLTLTVANHVIFFDRTFSLDDYLQAQDRIHRISQIRTCYVEKLVMPDSIDVWIETLLLAKEMAAKLAQGDISKDYYRAQMQYDFGEVLREILDIGRANGTD